MRYARVLAALAMAAMTSGCLDGFDGAGPGATGRRAPTEVQLMSKGMTISGPRGFCVDDRATRDSADSAFVVFASCAAISGNPSDSHPATPALLTAAFTPAPVPLGAEGLDRIASFLASDAGRAALARDGAEVEILDMTREPGLVLVHAKGAPGEGGISDDYWRAVFPAAGQLVTVTVSGYAATPLSPQAGARLTQAFAKRIIGTNRRTGGENEPESESGLAALFNRLL